MLIRSTTLSRLIPAAAFVLLLGGCDTQNQSLPAPQAPVTGEQKVAPKTLCVVDDYRGDVVAKQCVVGQKIAYLPGRWGNEQLPVMFAAVNCDLRHSIVQTNGGVICIYNPIELQSTEEVQAEQERAKAATPGTPAQG